MIKHIVMWNLKGDNPGEKAESIQQLRDAFDSMRGKIPGMNCLEIGIDSSKVDYACDVVLYSEFESQQALEAYAVHPEHLRVRHELEGLRITRHQVDYRNS